MFSTPKGDLPLATAIRRAFFLDLKEHTMKDRLTELEIKASLNEDLLEELNRTVYRQQQQIDLLQEQMRLLYEQMKTNAEPGDNISLRDEIPPHY